MNPFLLAFALLTILTGSGEAAAQAPGPLDREVALDLHEVPFRTALDRLFHGSDLTYAVTPGVPEVLITLKFKETRLEDAVRALMETASTQVPGIAATRNGGVYLIKIGPLAEPQLPREAQPSDQPPVEAIDQQQDLIWEKIPLNYLEASAAAVALGGAVFPGPQEPPGAPPSDVSFGPGGLRVRGAPA